MPVTWIKPKYVCEVEFTEWTNDGKMRHPIFMRMREDKSLKDIVMEKTKIEKPVPKKNIKVANDKDDQLKIGNIQVKISNRNKIYWPDKKLLKE